MGMIFPKKWYLAKLSQGSQVVISEVSCILAPASKTAQHEPYCTPRFCTPLIFSTYQKEIEIDHIFSHARSPQHVFVSNTTGFKMRLSPLVEIQSRPQGSLGTRLEGR